MKQALLNVLREEQRQLEDAIREEERRNPPDRERLAALRAEARSLRRQLDRYLDA